MCRFPFPWTLSTKRKIHEDSERTSGKSCSSSLPQPSVADRSTFVCDAYSAQNPTVISYYGGNSQRCIQPTHDNDSGVNQPSDPKCPNIFNFNRYHLVAREVCQETCALHVTKQFPWQNSLILALCLHVQNRSCSDHVHLCVYRL